MKKVKKIFIFLIFFLIVEGVKALPLKSTIFNSQNKPVGLIKIYIDYVELHELSGKLLGKASFVKTKSGFEIFIVKNDGEYNWVGRSSNRRLYDSGGNAKNYNVTTIAGTGVAGKKWQFKCCPI